MILTADIGNSAIVICCVEEGRRMARFSLAARERTADEYCVLLAAMLRRAAIAPETLTGVIVASVVPVMTPVVCAALEEMTGRTPLVVGPGVRSGLNIRMDDPTELGGDLVAAATAAAERGACSSMPISPKYLPVRSSVSLRWSAVPWRA